MRECDHCGGAVTAQFVRVFGDNDGRLHGCPDCSAVSELLPNGSRSRRAAPD